jgi:hypothetical protein
VDLPEGPQENNLDVAMVGLYKFLGWGMDRLGTGSWLVISSTIVQGGLASVFVRLLRAWLSFVDLAVTVVMGAEYWGEKE